MKYLLLALSLPLCSMEPNITFPESPVEQHGNILAPMVGLGFCVIAVVCWCWHIRPTPEEERPLIYDQHDRYERKWRRE